MRRSDRVGSFYSRLGKEQTGLGTKYWDVTYKLYPTSERQLAEAQGRCSGRLMKTYNGTRGEVSVNGNGKYKSSVDKVRHKARL